MKLCLLAFLFLTCSIDATAQDLAFVETRQLQVNSLGSTGLSTFRPKRWPREHCYATTAGIKGMIVGGSMSAVGIGVLLWPPDNDPTSKYGPPSQYPALIVAGVGVHILLVATAMFLGGEIYDHRTQRLSLIGSKDQLGIAYNFR